ncbi:methyl-accepting chemotaxis protein [Halanaeroarchaeum sulfurireducens]|uniref:Methyl-accepting chemotaxis protein n=1 Tax=Halanaeroarchaeum sulfurireducens TaxID=1604004 RepID=A0A0F7P5T6_9EURY|nr:methyl-accepting chemotaxis protein [Halanaeroarchaeum sulfurireducens]AKH96546.1 methyl-accepting chemotaxis protein [Halanaeroarchaeum sulfurireducens]ALG80948.1 methyl-accepting chemotaxis protein [Halanaeroarchaeum sulfurireducens]
MTTAPGGEGRDDETAFPLGFRAILDRIGTPLFVLDADGDVVHWNEAATELTGETEAEAMAKEHVSEAFYHDGRRAKTLADKVLEAPETADEKFGLPTVDTADYTLYRDQSTMLDANGNKRHIKFSAAPLYEGDELVGVVEMVQDRTDEVRQNRRTVELVEELEATMAKMQEGNLDARASVEVDEYLDAELAAVAHSLNEMGEQLQALVGDVSARTAHLDTATADVAESAQEINRLADEQSERTGAVADEVSTLSTTVQQAASRADDAGETSQQARQQALEGRERADELRSLMHDAEAANESIRDDVAAVGDAVDRIESVMEAIDVIATETSFLALYANVEAAKADDGDGVAVVANEIRNLAKTTRTRIDEVESAVDTIRSDTEEAVTSIETTESRIEAGVSEVEETKDLLYDVAATAGEAVEDIEEVSAVTDDQAESAGEIANVIADSQDKASTVAEEISDIAAATEEQSQQVAEIDAVIADLAGREEDDSPD